ncbi:IS4 family transposase, partial [Microcoleus sp. A003_D6]
LGGFLGRKHDGVPGVKTLWRGLRRLNDITMGWLLFNQLKTT